jgi:transposase InsO family protein
VIEICNFKLENPAKSHYYLYQLWIKEGKIPPCCPKTIYNWWKRRGLIVIRHRRKRRKTKLFNQALMPGELVQVDTKYLEGRKRYQYTAIDVVSKWRYLRAYANINAQNSIDFFKRLISKAKEKGITIKMVQTDNGHEFQTEPIKYLLSRYINHQYIWIHTPDQNGCVERSHRTDDEEFYQQVETANLTLDELNIKLEGWTCYYNTKRLHFSLNFATPEEYLVSHI